MASTQETGIVPRQRYISSWWQVDDDGACIARRWEIHAEWTSDAMLISDWSGGVPIFVQTGIVLLYLRSIRWCSDICSNRYSFPVSSFDPAVFRSKFDPDTSWLSSACRRCVSLDSTVLEKSTKLLLISDCMLERPRMSRNQSNIGSVYSWRKMLALLAKIIRWRSSMDVCRRSHNKKFVLFELFGIRSLSGLFG